MPLKTASPFTSISLPPQQAVAVVFGGFQSLQANFLYCPNQFFDVLLPRASRGCTRLVGYMLRQTLGYLDADGNPVHPQVEFTYNNLIEGANIARGSIREALDEALNGRFIECIREGQANSAGRRGNSALYALRWDDAGAYTREPEKFAGFFAGDGNRTTVPNEYFDIVLRTEPLAVARVVGTVLRFTIGFQTPQGGRRQQAKLSFVTIRDYCGIGHDSTVADALASAYRGNYIARVKEGYFDNNGVKSEAAIYGLKWFGMNSLPVDGSKNRAVELSERFKKPSVDFDRTTVQKTEREASKKPSAERFKKPSSIKDIEKEILKQQQQTVFPTFERSNDSDQLAAAADSLVFEILLKAGFDQKTATQLASAGTPESIRQQIEWLPKRQPSKNALGMLRLAILENWPEPAAAKTEPTADDSAGAIFAKHAYAAFGGNTGTPTAQPSRADIEAASPFVQHLLEVWPDPERVSTWGKHFGKFWISEEERTFRRTSSFAAALRIYGDSFFSEHKSRREQHERQLRQKNRQAHEARFHPIWLEYLREEEGRIRVNEPETYEEFADRRKRRFLEDSNNPLFKGIMGENLKKAAKEEYDSEEKRLLEFQGFFQEQVRAFWPWDKEINPTPFT